MENKLYNVLLNGIEILESREAQAVAAIKELKLIVNNKNIKSIEENEKSIEANRKIEELQKYRKSISYYKTLKQDIKEAQTIENINDRIECMKDLKIELNKLISK